MKNNLLNISSLLLFSIAGAVLTSCGSEEWTSDNEEPSKTDQNPDGQRPIVFTSVSAEHEEITRATTPLAKDFVVYGYKNTGDNEQIVFDKYTVKYEAGTDNTSADNTHGYNYVDPEKNQYIKYWDYSASEYHFWAVSAQSTASYSFSGDKNNVLTIPGMTLRVGEPDPDDILYSALYERRPVSAEVVQMQFKHPYAKVCIKFYTDELIKNDEDNVSVSDISFGPDLDASEPLVNKVYGKGNVVVTYPLTSDCSGNAKETVVVENLNEEKNDLAFYPITLDSNHGISSNTAVTAPVAESGDKYYYYTLPMDDRNPAFIMKASIDADVDDTKRTAVVPAIFMQWKPNVSYTYIFKITAGGNIEFYDAKIDPWKYGGSQNEEWKNW